MAQTLHLDVRMNQRALKRELVHLALDYGEPRGNKYVLDRKTALEQRAWHQKMMQACDEAAKKGGVTVIEVGGKLVTAYPTDNGLGRKKKGSN